MNQPKKALFILLAVVLAVTTLPSLLLAAEGDITGFGPIVEAQNPTYADSVVISTAKNGAYILQHSMTKDFKTISELRQEVSAFSDTQVVVIYPNLRYGETNYFRVVDRKNNTAYPAKGHVNIYISSINVVQRGSDSTQYEVSWLKPSQISLPVTLQWSQNNLFAGSPGDTNVSATSETKSIDITDTVQLAESRYRLFLPKGYTYYFRINVKGTPDLQSSWSKFNAQVIVETEEVKDEKSGTMWAALSGAKNTFITLWKSGAATGFGTWTMSMILLLFILTMTVGPLTLSALSYTTLMPPDYPTKRANGWGFIIFLILLIVILGGLTTKAWLWVFLVGWILLTGLEIFLSYYRDNKIRAKAIAAIEAAMSELVAGRYSEVDLKPVQRRVRELGSQPHASTVEPLVKLFNSVYDNRERLYELHVDPQRHSVGALDPVTDLMQEILYVLGKNGNLERRTQIREELHKLLRKTIQDEELQWFVVACIGDLRLTEFADDLRDILAVPARNKHMYPIFVEAYNALHKMGVTDLPKSILQSLYSDPSSILRERIDTVLYSKPPRGLNKMDQALLFIQPSVLGQAFTWIISLCGGNEWVFRITTGAFSRRIEDLWSSVVFNPDSRESELRLRSVAAVAVNVAEDNYHHPVARIFHAGLKAHLDSMGENGLDIYERIIHACDAEANLVFSKIKNNISILAQCAQLGPLVGLLGTVSGIQQTFAANASAAGGTEAIRHGIGEAIVNTLFGIGTAMIAQAFQSVSKYRYDTIQMHWRNMVSRVTKHVVGLGK